LARAAPGEDEEALGPDATEAERVLIVQTLAAPRPGPRLRRRPARVEPEPPGEVPLTRATVAHSIPFRGEREAASWLDSIAGDSERRVAEVKAGVRLLNRGLSAQRAAARDPLVQDVGASQALAIRIGYGTGDQVADGGWADARQLPPPPRSRREDIDPQQRMAAILGGREEVHPAETLLLRARLDIEQGRMEEAAHGVVAARHALRELPDPSNEELLRKVESELGQQL
jgi:hypothetical protein